MPFEQVTLDPGGTTMVFLCGGGFSWILRHPPKLSGINAASSNFFMRWILQDNTAPNGHTHTPEE
jgi:hypothetical protein